jgi:hypothetical protein
MPADNRIRDFMSRVVAWPDNGHGYVNLHWKSVTPTHTFWSGKPTKKIDDLLAVATWALTRDNVTDIYFCLSQQAEAGISARGKPSVVRNTENALFLKAIWLDIDVKEPPKGYASLIEAVDALDTFKKAVGLPAPSALIGSGGGLHVYWFSDTPLAPAEWRPYAEGLKALALKHGLRCDAGITTDAARILRVPGTLNYKFNPPTLVKILLLQDKDFSFATDLGMLATVAPIATHLPPTTTQVFSEQPAQAFAGLDPKDSLAAGITLAESQPLAWEPLVTECAFIRDALVTGGKDYSQPMWNLSTLASTFLESGHALAHKFGNKHPGYTRESTEALWDRKNRERKNRGLGWPSCAAIEAAGCTACKACPHYGKGKSPLNFTIPFEAPTTVTAVALAGAPVLTPMSPLNLPHGYALDSDGYICVTIEEPGAKGQPPASALVRLFYGKLSAPWAQTEPVALNFVTTADKGRTNSVSILLGDMGGLDMWKTLQRQGVKPVVRLKRLAEEFLMAWLSKLQDAARSRSALPFGWYVDDTGARHGFVYGGLLVKDDSTEHPSGFGDVQLRHVYTPTGHKQPWLDAAKLITDQKRPELDCILASSFAAPLMVTPAEYSALLSAWGDSGAGKTTAVKVAQAVWSHPKKSKEITMSTARSVIHRMGEVRNLPVYWDEIKNKKAQANVFDTFFTGSEGIGPSRLTSNVELRSRSEWQTMLIICSNISFVDHVVTEQKTTTAGMYRVFEYEIPRVSLTAPGQIDAIVASRITQELENNFGVVGMEYTRVLGKDPRAADQFTLGICSAFAASVQSTKEERFWVALCGTLLAGAEYANQLGAQIDIPAMQAFLQKAFQDNRERMQNEATAGGTVMNTEESLTGFLKTYVGETLYTDTFPAARGRPKAVTVISGPPMSHPKPIQVQWAVDDKVLRLSRPKFVEYLTKANTPAMQVINGLAKHFGATVVYARLGANTPYRGGQEHLIQIPIAPGSSLEAQMKTHDTGGDAGVADHPAGEAKGADPRMEQAGKQAEADLKLVQEKT